MEIGYDPDGKPVPFYYHGDYLPPEHMTGYSTPVPVQSQLEFSYWIAGGGLDRHAWHWSCRSHTELARFLAKRNGWLFCGDQLITHEGFIIADTIEDAAAAMHTLGWFDEHGFNVYDNLSPFELEARVRLMTAHHRNGTGS